MAPSAKTRSDDWPGVVILSYFAIEGSHKFMLGRKLGLLAAPTPAGL